MKLIASVCCLCLLGIVASFGQGRELEGVYQATETPALPPEEAQKRFQVPKGFEVRLFAAEPNIVNPVAMCWDERGRLWVVELYEYPLGAKPGEKPRDRVKILEDTDADGRADKVTIFKDGLNLATGILVGNGGAYVGQAPHLYFFQDTNGDDVADKEEILLTGFGLEDRHELLNGFTWGPDGYLYFTHGVFTHSKVRRPDQPESEGMKLDAGVARFHPRTRKFEVFADGTSNPWGVDFDRDGNAFVSACVIDHMFHMAAGGLYARQGGAPEFAYAYELLPSIVDHRHYRAAYAGIQVYQGDQYPAEYLGMVFHGNIHANMIHQDRLSPKGSSFVASHVQDFLIANDGWFRPVSTQTGPDGALWVMDWHDKYPCYQNARANPEGVDRKYGRIWRVVYTGGQPGKAVPSRPSAAMDLAKLSSLELVKLLEHPNNWQRRMAQRLLSERKNDLPGGDTTHPSTVLHDLMTKGQSVEARLAALWTLHGKGILVDGALGDAAKDKHPAMRAWAARLTGERGYGTQEAMDLLLELGNDPEPSVRLAVATAARQFSSSHLTVNRPPAIPIIEVEAGGVLSRLWFSSNDAKDPLINFMFWMALEPIIALDPVHALGAYEDGALKQMPLSGILIRKIMRRVCDSNDPVKLNASIAALGKISPTAGPTIAAALEGLVEGSKGLAQPPNSAALLVIAKFSQSSDARVAALANQLGAIWGDEAALQKAAGTALDSKLDSVTRREAIHTLSRAKTKIASDALLGLIATEQDRGLAVEALRALAGAGDDSTGAKLVALWPKLSPGLRGEAAQTLVSRKPWTMALLQAFADGKIARSDVPLASIRQLNGSRDPELKALAAKTLGNFRETSRDLAKIIAEKKRVVLEGPVDMAQGKALAQATCLVCHKFHGEGQEVGPDLTGSGRANLDALLTNIIDPNQIIGNGYENVLVTTKNGQTYAGRVTENSEARVSLLGIGGRLDTVAKTEVATMEVTKNSLMPEGLYNLPDDQFRHLVWYILNPPEDKRPLTEALKAELLGGISPAAKSADKDGESVALWNPEWRVESGEEGGSPRRLADYAGRSGALQTHPMGRDKPAALIRQLEVPTNAKLTFEVAADLGGDWDLRVMADREEIYKLPIDNGSGWKPIAIDLSRFAGKKITLRLENWANDWDHEFGYWREVKVN